MSEKKKIVNLGSCIMDLVFKVKRRPEIGETIVGLEFGMFTGGKGYNQAVAAARLGADVTFIGCLGMDYFGDLFITSLQNEGINTEHVLRKSNFGTGVASPVVYEAEKNNSIIIIPRANKAIMPDDIEPISAVISMSDLLMLQLEISMEASYRAAELAQKFDVPVMLNPAPYHKLPERFYGFVDLITPNEIEAEQLSGIKVIDLPSAKEAAKIIISRGPKQVVITMGQKGAYYCTSKQDLFVPAFRVNSVDPTAAGDAFCAGFAVAMLEGQSINEAIRMGNAAGGLATTVFGAEPSLPKKEQVNTLLSTHLGDHL